MTATDITTTQRPILNSTTASKRRRSLRIADSLVVVGLVVSYLTSSSVLLHALVSLSWSAAVGWHFWLHRKWFKSLARRLARGRSRKSRASAFVTAAISVELSAVVIFGVVAWLGPRSLKGFHGTLGDILLAVAVAHILLNLRQLTALVRRRSTVIDRRFRGASTSAQRGYAAGKAASHTQGAAKVEFLASTPVEQELQVEIDSEERVTIFHGPNAVMEACPDDDFTMTVPASSDIIEKVFARGPVEATRTTGRPHCFGCSQERGDGLGITTTPVGASGIWGSTWTPDETLPSTGGFVDDEVIWAALDCPGSFVATSPTGTSAEATGSPSLDAISVQILERVRIGEQLAVVGWTLSREDSGVDCGTAVIDRRGEIKAYAHLCLSISDANTPHGL